VITSSSCGLTVIAAPAQAYPQAVIADNAVAYFRLNETPDNGSGNNGVVTHDYRGGHNGYYSNTVLNAAGYYPPSDPDPAAQFGAFVGPPPNNYVADIKDIDFTRAVNATANFSVEA